MTSKLSVTMASWSASARRLQQDRPDNSVSRTNNQKVEQ
jgi:hypothetical protein